MISHKVESKSREGKRLFADRACYLRAVPMIRSGSVWNTFSERSTMTSSHRRGFPHFEARATSVEHHVSHVHRNVARPGDSRTSDLPAECDRPWKLVRAARTERAARGGTRPRPCYTLRGAPRASTSATSDVASRAIALSLAISLLTDDTSIPVQKLTYESWKINKPRAR